MTGLSTDNTERKWAEEKLREMSLMDDLTGLYNRRGFLTLATQQLKIAHRLKQGLALFYLDLDRMKWINDTLGHREGDRALIDTASILRNTFRASDIVARIGGDEVHRIIDRDIGDERENDYGPLAGELKCS